MDILGGASNLLQNRLFLQYLSGAGGAMAAGQPIAPALSQITQQTIGAQSQAELNKRYMDTIRKMISGGEVPAGWKLTRDEKGTKLESPADTGAAGAPGTAGTPAPSGLPDMSQLGAINPFVPSQRSVSAADFAGLGPQDVSRALSDATGVEALRQQSIANLLRARQPLEEPFPVEVPGVGTVSLREWQTLPQDERDYALFVREAKRLGDTDIMSRREFEMLEPTEKERFTRAAMKDPALMAAEKELRAAGATRVTVGERVAGKVAEKKALGKLKGQLWIHDPKSIDDINKHLNTKDMQRKIFMESQKEGGDPELMRTREAIKFIESKISVGGTILNVKLSEDGKTMTWSVQWDSGDIEDIGYVIRP